MARVLVVDDDPAVLIAIEEVLATAGHVAVQARSALDALRMLDGVEAVVTDYAMPEMDGLAFLRALQERDANLPVVMLTAQGSERVAVQAMKGGAYDYVTKPFDFDEFLQVVARALEARALRVENRRLSVERALGKAVVGTSRAMRELLETVERIAPKDVTVLVNGETGTGKELVATLLHVRSRRASCPLVQFNCAAIPGDLAEAELFGHTRGAFTGAVQARAGFFAEANGGTLVLDEVGELPAPVQAKLLRALQQGEIQPVGSGRIERVDVRVVACTNRDLREEFRARRFREDLYYRLAVVELVVPPLRDHREDIPALAAEFVHRFARQFGTPDVTLSGPLIDRLSSFDWPGNVRQLENTIARLVALSRGGEISADALPRDFGGPQRTRPAPAPPEDGAARVLPDDALTMREQLDAVERGIVARALATCGGNQSKAALRLGLSRSAFLDRLKKYGLGND